MRCRLLLLIATGLLVSVLPAIGQSTAKSPYSIVFDRDRDVTQKNRPDGKTGLHFTVRFDIVRQKGVSGEPGKDYKVVVEEDGREVARLDVPEPKLSEDLSAVLAIDISGSMDRDVQSSKGNTKRIDQARIAAESFVKRLPGKADCGLILFDHEIREQEKVPPSLDRRKLFALIATMQPRGGTAYLDATRVGISMLANMSSQGKARAKAVVVMTDGVDLNSTAKLAEVIQFAKKSGVNVHTIGIGEPGTGTPVNSVLVLDHSKSMEERADDKDKRSKIEALHTAAKHFVNLMPETAKTVVLAFGDVVDKLDHGDDFSIDKERLKAKIESLQPHGETAMLDAAFDAVAMLEARQLPGHRAVVVMTDGIDNKSRHRPEDVIERAKQANVKMYMLAFGRDSELVQAKPDMQKIAKETGGSFHHAKNEQDLIKIFEEMSNALHDDGIDEPSLKSLAKETGGEYHAARDINKLKLILDKLSNELTKKEYTITFDSPRGHDGTVRNIKIKLVRNTGEVVETRETEQAVQGVVFAEMNPFVYLGFLSVLGLMLLVPAALGRVLKSSA